MYVAFDPAQVETLRELLESSKKQLLREIAHSDTREYRESLERRETVVEQLLSKLSEESHRVVA
ncbi:MAG TPA: hypothetical protein VIV11_43415 [Kofleriaceae bacterium]